MIIKNLDAAFKEIFPNSDEIWVAVALANDNGYNTIQHLVNDSTSQNFVVGIDLPTTPSVLKEMYNKVSERFTVRVYESLDVTFHPKVYISRKNNDYKAVIGSSNLTSGGLNKNVEINYLIKDQKECKELIDWFCELSANSYTLTMQSILEYEKIFTQIENQTESIQKKERQLFFWQDIIKNGGTLEEYLDSIDFRYRFFEKKDFLAFKRSNWENHTQEAINERYGVVEKLLRLHNIIYGLFGNYGIGDLHEHYNPPNTTSSYFHKEGFTKDELKSIWLHYSKSKKEIRAYEEQFYGSDKRYLKDAKNEVSFSNHMRLQVIIHARDVGIWLYVGKANNGSPFDRQNIQEVLSNYEKLNVFFEKIKILGDDYIMSVGNEQLACNDVESIDQLRKFWRKDSTSVTSYIGTNIAASDQKLNALNFPKVVLAGFAKLYPLYDLLRDKRFK